MKRLIRWLFVAVLSLPLAAQSVVLNAPRDVEEYAEKTLDVLEKYGAADKPRQSAASVVGFILGLASFFCGCNIILAIMAIAFSCESGQNLTTRKNAFSRAGQILGVISILLFVIALILYFAAHINIFNYVRL